MEPIVKGRRVADRYLLLASIHQSAHTQIWLAQDDSVKSRVAIKIASNQDTVGVNLLKNEFAQCSRCVHANVVRTFELHSDPEITYLTLEYLGGGDFAGLTGRPLAQFLPAMIQIAEALHHVHSQGVVHRDVKLSNCLFDKRGHARLTDFGVASERGNTGLRSGGSPRSMSPQQRVGEPPEPGDDMYSFGIALFRLTEGRWPDEDGARADAGGTLSALIDQLLHPDPQQRPASMDQVAQLLRQVLNEQGNVTLPPDEFEFDASDDEKIEVIELSQPAPVQEQADPAGKRPGRRLVPLLLLYGVIGAAVLFYFIPRMAGDREVATLPNASTTPNGTEPVPASGAPVAPVTDVEPWKLAQQARTRGEAEETLERLLDRQFYLDDKKAVIWATDEFESIRQKAIAGDQLFRQKKYVEALEMYEQGRVIAQQLSDRADTILPDTLAAGNDALASGDAVTAEQMYQLALQIDPQSGAAQKGLERANNLDEVLALVNEGERLEQDGQVAAALAAYQKAHALDSQWLAASEGISRMQRRLASRAYAVQMSTGYQALERADFDGARRAFEQARKISPNSSEVREALAQLDTAIRLQDYSRIEARALTLEQQGEWRAAELQYKAALDKDSAQQSSREGLRRVRNRAELAEQLQELLAEPARLSNDSVYRQAEAVLLRLNPYASEPDVATQIDELRGLMSATRVPVKVQLKSDGETQVSIYRVGPMGRFTEKSLDLRPGEYTAVGTRTGFRDVRVNFTIAPGQVGTRIEVVCREAI